MGRARGSTVSLYLTGAGMMQPTPADGSLGTGAAKTVLKPSLSVSGIAAPAVLYAGYAPFEVQDVQLNFQIPASAYQSGYVPVMASFGDVNPSVPRQALVWPDLK